VSATDPHQVFHRIIEAVWRVESARVIAGLTRDLDLAEDPIRRSFADFFVDEWRTADFQNLGLARLNRLQGGGCVILDFQDFFRDHELCFAGGREFYSLSLCGQKETEIIVQGRKK
jgi:hypothetical protein